MLEHSIVNSKSRCLHCNRRLSWIQLLRHQRFCSEAHHQAYLAQHEQLAMAELTKDGAKQPEDPPRKTSQDASRKSLRKLKDAVGTSSSERPARSPQRIPQTPAVFYEHLLNHLPGGVAVYHEDGTPVYFNETYRAIWSETGGTEPAKVRAAVKKAFSGSLAGKELRIVLKPGKGGTVRLKLAPLPPLDGEAPQLVVFAMRVMPAGPHRNTPAKAKAPVA